MSMTNDRIGGLFKIGLPGMILDDETKNVLEQVNPAAVILFGRNVESPGQVARYIEDITAFLGRKPVVAIDQEGGIVTRLTDGFTVMPGPMALAAGGDPQSAYEAGRILGSEMAAVGIDWDLAPVVDVNRNPANRGIGVRAFSSFTDEVVLYAGEFIRGLREAGVLCCLKHFPGLGAAEADPHIKLPELHCSREDLMRYDIEPFLRLDAECWMPTHIWVPAIQSRREAVTVSHEVLTELIRDELGFGGLLVADDLNMGGVSNDMSIEKVVVDAFAAGMDLLSIAEGSEKQISSKKTLEAAVAGSELLQMRLEQSEKRINRVFKDYRGELVTDAAKAGRAEAVRCAERLSAEAIRLVKGDAPPPLSEIDNVFSMKPLRLVLVEEDRSGMPPAAVDAAEAAGCSLTEIERGGPAAGCDDLIKAADGGVNLVFTENAHLEPELSAVVSRLAEASSKMFLIALRNPWDADIEGVENALCSYGYTPLQQKALSAFLGGK